MEGSIEGDFCFGGCSPVLAPRLAGAQPPAVRSDAQIEDELWDSVMQSRDPRDFDAYLQAYPNGRYVAIARVKRRNLPMIANAAGANSASPLAAGSVPAAAGVDAPRMTAEVVPAPGRPSAATPASLAVRPAATAVSAPQVTMGSAERDPSALGAVLAARLSDGLARNGAGGSAVRVTVSFIEDVNRRSDRIFGAWRLDVAGAPGCSVQISERWFGRGGFAGVGQAKDEAVSAAYSALLPFLKERVYSGTGPSC
jgi:hypothetical protein